MSSVMITGALFQFGLGITIINRKADQEIMVKKEMKFSFLSYDIESDVTQHWNEFQLDVSNVFHPNKYSIDTIVYLYQGCPTRGPW